MDKSTQYQKFSTDIVNMKRNIKRLRMSQGTNMNFFAKKIGLTRKQLEDLETERNYGSYIGIDILCKCADVLGVSLDTLRAPTTKR